MQEVGHEPLLITVNEAAKMLGIGEKKLRELIMYEKIPVVRFGRAVRINPVKLREWLASQE